MQILVNMGSNSNGRKRTSRQRAKVQLGSAAQIDINKRKKMDLPTSNKQKKIWSLDTLKEALEPSIEELECRKEKLSVPGFLQKYSKLFKCTKCQLNIKPLVLTQAKVPMHPCLGVLMCESCCDYYQDGEFSLDSDGEDKYCRWCGEGGTIFTCSNCICGFCLCCIKRHFKTDYLKQVQKDENWLCFFCDPKPLWDLRFICSLAVKLSESGLEVSSPSISTNKEENIASFEDLNSEQNKVETEEDTKTESTFKKKKNRKQSTEKCPTELKKKTCNLPSIDLEEIESMCASTSSSDESDLENPEKRVRYMSTPLQKLQENNETDCFESMKDNVLSELKKILSLSEHKMNFGVKWSNNMLDKLSKPGYIKTHKGLMKECWKMKQVLSAMAAYLDHFSKSVDAVRKTFQGNDGEKIHHDFSTEDQSAYSNILKFLGFITNQVETFKKKGISLSDIFEAEVYDDDKIIGLQKKSDLSIAPSTSNRSENSCIGNNSKINFNDGSESKGEMELGKKSNSTGDAVDQEMENHHLNTADNDESHDNEDNNKCHDSRVMDERMDNTSNKESEDENKDNSSNATFVELNDSESPDPKDDIQHILAILENA